MKNKAILSVFIIIITFTSCSPCKRLSKHPECLPQADTVIKTNSHYEKVYITEDSLIYDTIPCDPVTETAVKVETVYKTIYKNIRDTVYQYVSKVNPLNNQLLMEKNNLLVKVEKKKQLNRIYLFVIIGLSLIIAIHVLLKKWLM